MLSTQEKQTRRKAQIAYLCDLPEESILDLCDISLETFNRYKGSRDINRSRDPLVMLYRNFVVKNDYFCKQYYDHRLPTHLYLSFNTELVFSDFIDEVNDRDVYESVKQRFFEPQRTNLGHMFDLVGNALVEEGRIRAVKNYISSNFESSFIRNLKQMFMGLPNLRMGSNVGFFQGLVDVEEVYRNTASHIFQREMPIHFNGFPECFNICGLEADLKLALDMGKDSFKTVEEAAALYKGILQRKKNGSITLESFFDNLSPRVKSRFKRTLEEANSGIYGIRPISSIADLSLMSSFELSTWGFGEKTLEEIREIILRPNGYDYRFESQRRKMK
jgi:hypothetical protein